MIKDIYFVVIYLLQDLDIFTYSLRIFLLLLFSLIPFLIINFFNSSIWTFIDSYMSSIIVLFLAIFLLFCFLPHSYNKTICFDYLLYIIFIHFFHLSHLFHLIPFCFIIFLCAYVPPIAIIPLLPQRFLTFLPISSMSMRHDISMHLLKSMSISTVYLSFREIGFGSVKFGFLVGCYRDGHVIETCIKKREVNKI